MKKMLITVIVLGLILVGISTVMAGGDKNRGEIGVGDTYENGCVDQPCFEDAPKPGTSTILIEQSTSQVTLLDQDEIDHLTFIREEEKLARDVYRVLYEKWGNPVFANIIDSEQAHMDAMANLLDFYGIEDPVTEDTTGVFKDDYIRGLFSELTGRGLTSETEALLVGGFIEEYDILDIWKAHEETDEELIKEVYQNLYEGSYNHLRAFVYNYETLTGDIYEPQLLSTEQYDFVMAFDTQAKQAQNPKQQKGR